MKWQMTFDRVSVVGDIKEKVVSKFSGLETFLGRMKDRVESGFVVLSKGERWGYKVKTKFRLSGHEVVAQGRGRTLLTAIDEAYAKASREVKSYLERMKDKRKT